MYNFDITKGTSAYYVLSPKKYGTLLLLWKWLQKPTSWHL